MSAHIRQRISNTVAAVAFLVCIGAPLAGTIAGIDGGDQAAENRELAPFPHFSGTWQSALGYPAAFDQWFSDHFALRSTFVRWFGESRYFWLGVSPTPQVIVGNDSFLFYGDDFSVDDYANDRPFTEFDLANWRLSIVRLRDWLERQKIAYVFTVAPDKHHVYPEELPDSIQQVGSVSRADQLYGALSDTRVLADLRPVLSHAKASERIYFLTDTHWNDRGAFAAYQTIIQAVRAQNPAVPPAWERSDFEPVSRTIEGRDLAGMMGLTHVLHEDELGLVPKRARRARVVDPRWANMESAADVLITEIPGSTLPRAVIFRDSFTSGLAPFLSEHFSRAVYVWANDVDANLIERERPDVVIQEIVSRHLYSFVPSPELVPGP